jgi:hypothetical protein
VLSIKRPHMDPKRLFQNPLPLGEGRVRVLRFADRHPHPNPLPEGEGVGFESASKVRTTPSKTAMFKHLSGIFPYRRIFNGSESQQLAGDGPALFVFFSNSSLGIEVFLSNGHFRGPFYYFEHFIRQGLLPFRLLCHVYVVGLFSNPLGRSEFNLVVVI